LVCNSAEILSISISLLGPIPKRKNWLLNDWFKCVRELYQRDLIISFIERD
jgi:hypothetical protein